MNDIFKIIKSKLKEDLKAMSFKLQGKWYIRVINKEIYQSIWFQSSRDGKDYTINIGIFPICGEYRNKQIGNIRIGYCINKGIDKWWDNNEESIDEVVSIIKEEVLPIFNSIKTYNSLYNYIEKQIINIKREKRDFTDISTFIWDFINNKNLALLCCKLEKYDKAIICLNNGIDEINDTNRYNLDYYDRLIKKETLDNSKNRYINMKNEYLSIMNKKIEELEDLKLLINNNEFNKINNIISKNEEQNINMLKDYIII